MPRRALCITSRHQSPGLSGPLPGKSPALHAYDLKERKDAVLITPATNFVLSFDGKKILYAAARGPAGGDEEEGAPGPRTYGIIDAKPSGKEPYKAGEGALNLASMRAEVDPRAEWDQIFKEVWRQERD